MAKLMISEPAPLFRLPDLDGKTVGLDDFLGRTVVVNFWSAECPWSERADRTLTEWKERVILLSIASNANEPEEMLRQAAHTRGLPLVLYDPDQQAADMYGVETVPALFLIDAGGVLRYQGAFDDVTFRQRTPTRNYIVEALEALLTDGAPALIEETVPFGCALVRKFDER